MKKFIYAIVLLTVSLFCCACNVVNAEGNKYASNIFFNTNTIYKSVGDKFKIDDSILTVLSNGENISPVFESENLEICTINENEVSCIAVGTAKIKAGVLIDESTYKFATLTIVVLEKEIYPTEFYFENSEITLNYNETATNKLHISPSNVTVTPTLTYSKSNIVRYDYVSGNIVPLTHGETKITARIKTDEINTMEISFNVVVTNYNYASNLRIPNFSESETVDVLTNSEYTLNFLITPSNYNMGIEIVNNFSDYVTLSENGKLVTLNKSIMNAEIEIILKSSNNTTISKTIKFNIIKPISEISYEIHDEEHMVLNAYVTNNKSYQLKINASADFDPKKLFFMPSNAYSITATDVNTVYNIKFNVAGLIDIVGYYENYSLNNVNKVYFNNAKFRVFNCVNNINLNITNGNEEIPYENQTYMLYLFNKNNNLDANKDLCFDVANLKYSSITPNILESNLKIRKVYGTSVELNNNILTAVREGETVFEIYSEDPDNFVKTIKFLVSECLVKDIEINTTNITLYLTNDNAEFPNYYNLNAKVVPVYALNNNIIVDVENNEIVSYVNSVVTALNVGETNIVFHSGNVSKSVHVNVKPVVNELEANVTNLNLCVNERFDFIFEVYSIINGNRIKAENKNMKYYFVNDNNGALTTSTTSEIVQEPASTFISRKTLTFIKAGKVRIRFVSLQNENASCDVFVNVTNTNAVLSASFSKTSVVVNKYLQNSFVNPVLFELENNEQPTTDVITFESDNENVATVNSEGCVMLLSQGITNISLLINGNCVDCYVLTVINKKVVSVYNNADFENMTEDYIYNIENDITLDNSFVTINHFIGELCGNGYSINNAKNTIFNTIGLTAVIDNITINKAEINSDASCGLLANSNNGIIKNVKVLNAVVCTSASSNAISLAGLVYENFNNIENCELSINFYETRTNLNASNSSAAGVVYQNTGVISNIKANLLFDNFSKCAGLVYYNSNKIENVNATIIFDSTYASNVSKQAAGGVYSTKSIGQTLSSIVNCNLEVQYLGNDKLTYGGLAVFEYDSEKIENCFVHTVFAYELNESKIGLFIYYNASNEAVFQDCSYWCNFNYAAVISGNDYFIKK